MKTTLNYCNGTGLVDETDLILIAGYYSHQKFRSLI